MYVYPLLLLISGERDLIHRTKDGNGIRATDEIAGGRRAEEGVVAVGVTVTLAALLLRLEDIGLYVVGVRAFLVGRDRGGEVLEDMLRVEELGVDVLWGQEVAADNENLSGDISEGGRL